MENKNDISLILKCTRECNLQCKYCRDKKKKSFESFDIIKASLLLKNLESVKDFSNIHFIWHGGEPLLLGLPFFRKMYYVQSKFFPKSNFTNSLQTNGTLLTKDWIDHFKEYGFDVSISMDGTEDTHNRFRVFDSGAGSYEKVIDAISLLRDNDLDFGVLTVVSDDILRLGAEKLIDSYRKENFINIALLSLRKIWRTGKEALDYNKRYGRFMASVLNYWIKNDLSDIGIREIDSKMNLMFGIPGRVCKDCGECVGKHFGVEASGDIFHCDRFVSDNRFFFGNIFEESMQSILQSDKFKNAVTLEKEIRAKCKVCKWYNICKGGCLYNLISLDYYGGKRGTDDCIDYQMFESVSDEIIENFPKQTSGITG